LYNLNKAGIGENIENIKERFLLAGIEV